MSRTKASAAKQINEHALTFAALGDRSRLRLITQLADGALLSISTLSAGSKLTRQAITKHLGVLEGVGLVHSIRSGRETLFVLETKPMAELSAYLNRVSGQWDEALIRLKDFLEEKS
jgi:DNA-binding transcriptional ArsR family regulator